MKLTFRKTATGEFLFVRAINCSDKLSTQEVTFSENKYEITLGSKEIKRKIEEIYNSGYTIITCKHYKTATGCTNAIIRRLQLNQNI